MLIAGNWKMHRGPVEAREFCARLRARLFGFEGADVIVCPPYPSLHDAVGILASTEIGVFAQSAHWAKEGPYTGEVSPWMLKDMGVGGTLVAHSERRDMFGETDESSALRIEGSLDAGLDVIACVGETEASAKPGDGERAHAPGDAIKTASTRSISSGSLSPTSRSGRSDWPDGDARAGGGGAQARSSACSPFRCSTADR